MPRQTRKPKTRSTYVSPSAESRIPKGPSQRQLRAGELVRHALVEILRHEDLTDPALFGATVTVTEVRMSPDLRNATCFVEPLGGERAAEIVAGLNRVSRFLRGKLGHAVDLKNTPELKFIHDESFSEAIRMGKLFEDPKVRQDLVKDAGPTPDDA